MSHENDKSRKYAVNEDLVSTTKTKAATYALKKQPLSMRDDFDEFMQSINS